MSQSATDVHATLCSICLNECHETRRLSPCGHEFCRACIGEWSHTQMRQQARSDPSLLQPIVKCPNCKQVYIGYETINEDRAEQVSTQEANTVELLDYTLFHNECAEVQRIRARGRPLFFSFHDREGAGSLPPLPPMLRFLAQRVDLVLHILSRLSQQLPVALPPTTEPPIAVAVAAPLLPPPSQGVERRTRTRRQAPKPAVPYRRRISARRPPGGEA